MEAAMAGGGRGRSTMRTHIWCMLLVAVAVTVAEAWTEPRETAALRAVKAALVDPQRSLRNWEGDDPCGVVPWTGVFCEEDAGGVSHVTEVRLMRLGLGGTLAGEVGDLQQLRTLNLMWNQVGGPLPASIGNFQVLELLLLSGNNFMGPLPPEMSRLSKMTRLQIDSNSFTQSIPSEFTNLTAVQHFHMNNNSLSGVIPPGLGNLPDVIHIILDNNLLTGKLPPDLLNGSSPRLQIVQVDNNPLDAQQLPASIGPHLVTLSLRNCSLFGSIPGLAGGGVLSSLQALDLRDNRLTGSFPDLSSAPNLSTVALSGNSLAQNISSLPSVANLTSLQALLLAGNNFTGSLDTVQLLGPSRPSEVLVDLQNNNITGLATVVPPNVTLLLAGNEAICIPDSPLGNMPVCQPQSSDPSLIDSAHTDGSTDCQRPCSARAVPKNIGEECLCLSPVTAGLRLMSPSFTLFNPYQREYEEMVAEQLTRLAALPGHTNQTVSKDQVYVRNYTWTAGQKLRMDVQIFPDGKDPSGQFQQQAQADELYTFFALWKIVDRTVFGPYELLSWDAGIYGSVQQPKGHRGIGVGAVVGIVVAAVTASSLAVALVALYCFRNRKFRGSPIQRVIVMGRSNIVKSGSSSNALLNVTGVQAFSFDDMCFATEGFSNSRKIGQGGYGKVYSGVLEDGVKVAIKRAQEGSLQGSREFYTEIELLSRVHHRNLVRLLGFCDDQGEQMLVYEYISGGTLRDYLSPTSTKPPLPFEQRLRIALGSARGIAYLHNEANPPIFHRDIKASNILLDDKGNAKVADFGLSKLAPATDMDGSNPAHVSTVVKGTPGYLDPEYFLTHKLTDKSDVYSFGVVLLELITGMHPISHGKNIVREVYAAHEAGHVLAVVDTRMGAYLSEALEPLVRLALSCCRDSQEKRPSTLEVVRDLEDIWRTTPTLSLVSSESPSHQHQPRRSLSLKSGHDDDSFADATDVLASRTVLEVAPR